MESYKAKFDVAGWMVNGESGLHVTQLIKTIEYLSNEEVLPFQTEKNNIKIVGFITCKASKQYEIEVKLFLEALCEEWPNEQDDKIYTTGSGVRIFIDCDSDSIIVSTPQLVTCQAEGCIDGQVDGEQCDICAGSSLVSEGEPGSESYELMNENSIDESGILQVNQKDSLFDLIGALMVGTDTPILRHLINAIGKENINSNLELLWNGYARMYTKYYPEEKVRSFFKSTIGKLGIGPEVTYDTGHCDACYKLLYTKDTEYFVGNVNGADFDGQVCIPCKEKLKTGTYDPN
ncbi:hypothetical protein [Paenibacillus sp. FSL P4-0288]|uniref:hypothetical protein n=1 Tax=Paenibacillus sp. FSL P4-0288 TaxID=2921633 RepID=UPI0030FB1020